MAQVIGRATTLAIAGCIAIAACGGSSNHSATVNPATNASSRHNRALPSAGAGSQGAAKKANAAACKFITQADATALFGRPASATSDDMPETAGTGVCIWSARTDPGKSDDLDYSITTRIYPGESIYQETQFPGATPLQGLGDRAFIHRAGSGGDLWFVRHGATYAISFSIVGFGADSAAGGTASTRLEALVRKAVARA